ncbi:MAG: hypothetical protein HC896_15510 [Bacteroidales bacterium]|nr:hypothetical protein [Bacteroidales bacterium]
MFKIILITVQLAVFLIASSFFADNVSIDVNAPDNVNAGEEFRVQVTIKKGRLSTFSRFSQQLPAGLKATPVNTANAVDFTFEEDRVRIIWLKLPEDDEFTFSYKVKVDQRLKGQFNLSGTFSYIDNNERKNIETAPGVVAIAPSPDIDPSLIVDINDFEKISIPDLSPRPQTNIACVRQRPAYDPVKNEVTVNLLVNKEKFNQFAKIEEIIPEGFVAIKDNTRDGIFTFNNNMARFIWRNLPAGSNFMVSYKLIPNEAMLYTNMQDVNIDGRFRTTRTSEHIPWT